MPFQWDLLVIPFSESLLPQDNLVANLHQEQQPKQTGEERRWPSVPCHGFHRKCEGASSLFIFSTSSSGPIRIRQHYFYLAYTSSVRGSLTSTSFLPDSVKTLGISCEKQSYENTLSGNVPCWIKATYVNADGQRSWAPCASQVWGGNCSAELSPSALACVVSFRA